MKIPATRTLNPAFKRFQYLPHLPPSRSNCLGCAAPGTNDLRSEPNLNPPSAGSRSDGQPQLAILTSPAEDSFAITS